MIKLLFILSIQASLALADAPAVKEISLLFIGNSYTYSPGNEADPGLPRRMKRIVETIDPFIRLNYVFNTRGGYSFERHYYDPATRQLLAGTYDHVILQGHSIESLELTPWMKEKGFPCVARFEKYLPQILELLAPTNSSVNLFVNWGWNRKHSFLQPDHPGLRFPEGFPNAGQPWAGRDQVSLQKMIDESYSRVAKPHSAKLVEIGRTWLKLQDQHLVNEDELYVQDDWSHPTLLGSFVTALVFVRDVLKLDIEKNSYVPWGVHPGQAYAIQAFLAKHDR